ncbi:uncharacterized protein LOC118491594 [Helianthus annuus]|uniref:uncharacterized protein LOC118491594 n=1 Tax=Helianthus annuus TaxID=4232 RepID=UPI001652BD13|nr:uncharacterized protein LOC118491594 [Helianthus annuus]
MERIDVMLWYGGCLDFSFDQPQYIDGNCKLIQMDFDHIAYFELVDYALETNEYESRDFYMYGMDADNGDFKLSRDDKDVLELAMKVVEEPVHEASWAFDIDKETNLKEVVKESVKEVVQEEVFGQHSDKEADLEQDSEDSDYNEESSCDDDEDCYSDDDEVLEELVGLDSDIEDLEWKQSQDAIKQATKDEEAATKKIIEECIKHNEKEGNFHESNDASCAHVEGYSSYEESDGDIATPGDSEEDDVRGKKFRETAPSAKKSAHKKLHGSMRDHYSKIGSYLNALRKANPSSTFKVSSWMQEGVVLKKGFQPMDPPPIKSAPGRPKKNRKRDPHEDPKRPGKLTKHGVIMKCSNCGARGHNKRKCTEKGKTTEGGSAPKRRKKSTKKATKQSTQEATQQSTHEATQQSTQEPTQKSTQKGTNKSSQKGKRKTNQG